MNAFLSKRFILPVSLLLIISMGATTRGQDGIQDPAANLPETMERRGPDEATEPEIAIDSLDSINMESLGLVNDLDHNLGKNLWKGSKRSDLEFLLESLPASQRSAASHNLMTRLLLAPAPVPKKNDNSPNLLEIRLEKLAALGEFKRFGELYSVVPKDSKTPVMQELQGKVWFLQRDLEAACSMAKLEVQETSRMFWQKALCICQAINGNVEEALFSLNLLRELLGPEDDDFYELTSVLLGQIPETSIVPKADVLNLVLLTENGLGMPEQWISESGPAIQKSIALADNIPLMTRLIAAEHAALTGTLAPLALAEIYQKIVFEEAEFEAVHEVIIENKGPWARALLHQASRKKQLPQNRAKLLEYSWKSSLESSNAIAIAVTNMEAWLSLPVHREIAFAAPTIIRALLSINASNQFRNIELDDESVTDEQDYQLLLEDPDTALEGLKGILVKAIRRNDQLAASSALNQALQLDPQNPWLLKQMITLRLDQWLQLMRENAETDQEYDLQLASLRPILAISNMASSIAWQPIMADQWWNSFPPEMEPLDKVSMANSLFVVLHALGYEIGTQNWSLLRQGPIIEVEQVPNVGVRFGMRDAALSNRVGDTLLFALLTLGHSGITEAGPVTIGSALRHLKHVGLVSEAKTLALEFLLNNGL